MNEIELHNFAEFHETIETYHERTIIYRSRNKVDCQCQPYGSHRSGGVIQITRDTYEQIKADFLCEPRGTIYVNANL